MYHRKTPKLFTCCLLAAILFLLPFKQMLGQKQPVTKADSLVRLLLIMKDDTNKINLLDKLCESYVAEGSQQKVSQYANQELELARRLAWVKGQVMGLARIGVANGMTGNLQSFFSYLKEAYELAKKNRLTALQYDLQLDIARMYAINNNHAAAFNNAKPVLEHHLQFRPKEVDTSSWFVRYAWWDAAYTVGDIYYGLKKDTAALNLYQQIKNRFIRENDSLGIRTALNLSMRYSNDYMLDYDRVRKYCFEELKYFRRGDTSAAYASVITYIANAYRLQKNYVKALEYYRTAMAVKQDANIEIKNSANSGMRLIYFELGDYEKALALDLEQLKDAVRMNYTGYKKIDLYIKIADDYNLLKQYDKSLFYLNTRLKFSDKVYGMGGTSITLISLANLYYLTHRYDEALLRLSESTRDPFFKTDRWAQYLNLLYMGKIIRDAPDGVLQKHGVPAAKKYQKSASMLQKALVYFKSNQSTFYQQDCYKELSTTYDSLKDYQNFYNTYKRYIALRDSSINRENQNAFISKLADIRFEKIEDSLKYQQRITDGKLQEQTLLAVQQRRYYISGIVSLLAVSFFIGRNYYNQRRSNKLITTEKQRSDNLLLNILPADVAEELKEKGSAGARLYEEVTVLFTDFVNFTTVSEMLTPQELVDELHTCFKAFDEIISKYGIEKIKTIGDAYLAVAGLPNADVQHASNTVKAALEIRQFIHDRKERMGSRSFDIRIGIHSGSVVAGIVGVKKFAYDIWGDTVNTAARMEQHSMPGQINLSEKTYELVKDQFVFAYRGEIEAKNKGALKMYFVEKQSASMSSVLF